MTHIPNTELYNADYRLHDSLSVGDAVSLLYIREKAHVVEYHDPPVFLTSPTEVFPIPSKLVLKKYANKPVKKVDDVWATREGVLRRDNHQCAYCGGKATTWDHILPKSRGGAEVWINMIAACAPCNHHKADRTPEEAGMKLLWEPKPPKQRDKYHMV